MGNTVHKLYYGDAAERKTSLGRDWHPTCLKCYECGRVLTPGQHAEHKGNPYCHTPCYKALFGPSLLGYGQNVASPANFAKKENAAEFGHDYDDDVLKREIYSHSRSSAAVRRQKQRRSAPASIIDHFNVLDVTGERNGNSVRDATIKENETLSNSDPTRTAATPVDRVHAKSVSDRSGGGGVHVSMHNRAHSFDSANGSSSSKTTFSESRKSAVTGNCISASNSNHVDGNSTSAAAGKSLNSSVITTSENGAPTSVYNCVNVVNSAGTTHSGLDYSHELADILEKVDVFNGYYEGKVHHQMTVEKLPNEEVKVQGPLRVYWGLSRPIQLRQCDNVPAPPIAKWRHSLCVNVNDALQNNNTSSQKSHSHEGPGGLHSPHRTLRGMDDSVLLSPASTDDVVMRRKVRKFNTVAYRNDAPTKWKRASINGHIFNYDTSVFVPVLGSSTSVIVDSTMTAPVVIQTLLDKFKVENSPVEYVLSVMTEKGEQTDEHLLGEGDYPLLERLELGADESNARIFLKERVIEPEVTVPDSVQLPIMEEEEEEETLPAEVEQLMILPVAVLKGILIKYEKDEEREVRLLKAKFERVRRKFRKRLEELQTA